MSTTALAEATTALDVGYVSFNISTMTPLTYYLLGSFPTAAL